jgi:tRNA (guanine6-N2)-methyltransferase
MSPTKPRRRPRRHLDPETSLVEAHVVAGLEAIARQEITATLGQRVRLHRPSPQEAESGDEESVIHFTYAGGLRALLRLKTVQAVHRVRRFDVPRPRALLGDAHFRALLADIAQVREVHPPDAFQTFYLSAAGSESAVMARLKEEIARHTGLREASHEGDLLLRLRRPAGGGDGWEVVIRLSPRPLATRPWRVCNMEGALNATVAHAMALMTAPMPHDVFLNVGCGSGTLLIERLTCAPARRAIGCDTSPEALACAQANVQASGYAASIDLHGWDGRSLPLPDASVDALCADLPFGHLVGSHDENVLLYPQLMAEAARVAGPGTLFSLITHEVRLMESLLEQSPTWRVEGMLRITLSGLHPRIFVLRRV